MSKNFLLSKISVLTLTAVVLNSLIAPAWSMEDEKNSISHLTINHKNEDVSKNSTEESVGTNYFAQCPPEIKASILEIAAFDVGEKKKDLSHLALVCKDWNRIVNNENSIIKHMIKKSWVQGLYNIIDPQEKEIFELFYKGRLIYRPNEGSDEGMIILPISALRNPLNSSFDLSRCGDTGQYLSIATGYRKVQTPANANKVEIWFTPRFLVDKEMPHLAPNHHMRAIIGSWDAARAPIGIFWTWGGWNATDHMTYCDYLTTESMEQLGTANLLKKALATRMAAGGPVSGGYTCCRAQYGGAERRRVHISFLN